MMRRMASPQLTSDVASWSVVICAASFGVPSRRMSGEPGMNSPTSNAPTWPVQTSGFPARLARTAQEKAGARTKTGCNEGGIGSRSMPVRHVTGMLLA